MGHRVIKTAGQEPCTVAIAELTCLSAIVEHRRTPPGRVTVREREDPGTEDVADKEHVAGQADVAARGWQCNRRASPMMTL